MTPIWETVQDRTREQGVADFIADILGLRCVNTSTTSPIDFELYNHDSLHAVMEVKCRNIRWGQYDDFRVDKSKIDKVDLMAQDRYCAALIVVRCNDRIGITNAPNFIRHATQGVISRTDRNDRNDTDRAYCMPWDKFNRVVTTPDALRAWE